MPSGAATRTSARMSVAPRDLSSATAEFIDPPVASIGSRTIAVRAGRSRASRSTYGSGCSVAWLRAMPTTLTFAFGIVSSTPSSMPSPARRIGTTVTFLPLMRGTSSGPLQHCTGTDLEREIGGRLVGQQAAELGGDLAKALGRQARFAQQADLVAHERMPDLDDGHGGP